MFSTKPLLRINDLLTRKIFTNRPALKRAVDNYDFPAGRFIGDATRVWTEEEIEEWFASRPVQTPEATLARAAKGRAARQAKRKVA